MWLLVAVLVLLLTLLVGVELWRMGAWRDPPRWDDEGE